MANDILPPPPPFQEVPIPPPSSYPFTILEMVQRLSVVETQNLLIMSEQEEAKKSRSLLHEKLDAMKDTALAQTNTMNNAVTILSTTLQEMRPVVALHERIRLQFKGAGLLLGFLWSLVVLGVGFVAHKIWSWMVG